MKRPNLVRLSVAGLSIICLVTAQCALAGSKRALSFDPRDLRNERGESRDFDASDEEALLQAVIALLQDLQYLVISVDPEAGIVVSNPPGMSWQNASPPHNLTIAIQAAAGGRFTVRASLAASGAQKRSPMRALCDETTTRFLQDIHARLSATLVRLESER